MLHFIYLIEKKNINNFGLIRVNSKSTLLHGITESNPNLEFQNYEYIQLNMKLCFIN